jgi:hypothetical protein
MEYQDTSLGTYEVPETAQVGHLVTIDGETTRVLRTYADRADCYYVTQNGHTWVDMDNLVYTGFNTDNRHHTWTYPA